MEKHPEKDGCMSAFKRLDVFGKTIESQSNIPRVGSFTDFAINGNFFTPMLCVKKSSFDAIGGFKKIDRFQDRYLMLHCLLEGQVYGVLNEPLYIMHEHEEGRITNVNLEKTKVSFEMIYNFIAKNKNLFTSKEWEKLNYNHKRSIGIAYYVNSSFFNNIKGLKYWFQVFLMNFKITDFLMIFKSLLPRKKQ